jgi:phage anti-repressor protein
MPALHFEFATLPHPLLGIRGTLRQKDRQNCTTLREFAFIEGVDFSSELRRSPAGRLVEQIFLTVDCFEHFCLMAKTDQGREVRNDFIKCRRELMQIKSQPQPQASSSMGRRRQLLQLSPRLSRIMPLER